MTRHNVVKLLDQVNWRMYIYSCEQTCSNFSYSDNEFRNVCPSSTCCFSDRIDDLLLYSFRYNGRDANDVNSLVTSAWFVLLIFGLLCLLGNIFVICDKTISLIKTKTEKEIQIYRTLVLNLALSDSLMGVYLIGMAFEFKHKATPGDEFHFSNPGICNVLGIMNTVSSQVSITILFIISVYRLVSVTKPFKTLHFKSVILLIIITWALWLVIAILPLIPVEPFEATFTFGLTKNRQRSGNSIIDFPRFRLILQRKILPSFDNFRNVQSILQQVIEFPTAAVLEKFSSVIGLLHSEINNNWTFLGYYDFVYTCSANFISVEEEYHRSKHFGLSLVFYNLILSVGILIGYILVTIKIYENDKCCSAPCKFCTSKFCCNFTKILGNNAFFQPKENVVGSRSAENLRMLKRITVTVLTDVICWIPLCVT